MPVHSHEYLSISLMLNGFLQETSECGNTHGHGSRISIKPVDLDHSDIFIESSTLISFQIFDPLWFGLDEKEWRWLSSEKSLGAFLNVLNSKDKKVAIKDLKSCLNTSSEKVVNHAPEWVEDIHSILCKYYHDPIRVSELARRFKKHPVYLTRVFKKHYGFDIKTFQKNLRIGHALAESLNTNRSLTEIAYDSGFSDQSHFNREFKKSTGFTPKKLLKV